jgi:hypothetical protein
MKSLFQLPERRTRGRRKELCSLLRKMDNLLRYVLRKRRQLGRRGQAFVMLFSSIVEQPTRGHLFVMLFSTIVEQSTRGHRRRQNRRSKIGTQVQTGRLQIKPKVIPF